MRCKKEWVVYGFIYEKYADYNVYNNSSKILLPVGNMAGVLLLRALCINTPEYRMFDARPNTLNYYSFIKSWSRIYFFSFSSAAAATASEHFEKQFSLRQEYSIREYILCLNVCGVYALPVPSRFTYMTKLGRRQKNQFLPFSIHGIKDFFLCCFRSFHFIFFVVMHRRK